MPPEDKSLRILVIVNLPWDSRLGATRVWMELAEQWRAGARGFIFGVNPPYDRETIERLISDVRPRLEQLVL